jgi:DNA-binding NarL/FixJ family response regulator
MPDFSPSVLLIDPHPVVLRGLVTTLKDVPHHADVAACSSFADARRFLGLRQVGLVISEFRIDGETIIDLLKTLTTNGTGTRCLVFSAFDESRFGATAIRGGASGFLPKSAPLSDLTAAIQSILAGRPWISDRLARALTSPVNPGSPTKQLTPREREIFTRLGNGDAVSRIATELGLSVKTIEAHREHIKTKLGLQTATQVTIAASRWIDDPAAQI